MLKVPDDNKHILISVISCQLRVLFFPGIDNLNFITKWIFRLLFRRNAGKKY